MFKMAQYKTGEKKSCQTNQHEVSPAIFLGKLFLGNASKLRDAPSPALAGPVLDGHTSPGEKRMRALGRVWLPRHHTQGDERPSSTSLMRTGGPHEGRLCRRVPPPSSLLLPERSVDLGRLWPLVSRPARGGLLVSWGACRQTGAASACPPRFATW